MKPIYKMIVLMSIAIIGLLITNISYRTFEFGTFEYFVWGYSGIAMAGGVFGFLWIYQLYLTRKNYKKIPESK